jgi:acyl-CoA thioesterase
VSGAASGEEPPISARSDDIVPERLRDRLERSMAGHEPEFERFFLFHFFGLSVTYGPETCRVDLPVEPFMFNPQGSLHGGIITLALDVSMGHLLRNEGATSVTLELNTNFVRAVTGPAYCEARFLKLGRRVAHVASDLLDDQDRLCASATATFLRLPDQSGEGA